MRASFAPVESCATDGWESAGRYEALPCAGTEVWDPRIVRMKQPNDTDTLFDASGVDLTTQSCGVAGCR